MTKRAPGKRKPEKKKSYGGGLAKTVGGGLGSIIGNTILPGAGGAIGGALGSGLGWAFSKITGMGDYKISSNTLVKASPIPSFGENCIRIRHKEYLGDVLGSTLFTSLSLPINPGLPLTFPWLSAIAANYEEYCFNGLVFAFVSTSATALNSTNTALGKIVMATDYNAIDVSFANVSQMLATEFSNYGKPAEDLLHAVECDPRLRPTLLQYVRSSAVPSNADARLYDLGNFQIASQGMQAAANIGGLWVSYDITLCKPVISKAIPIYDDFINLAAGTVSMFTSTTSNSSPAGIGGTISATAYTFPPTLSSGVYQISLLVLGDGKTSETYTSPFSSTPGMALNTGYFLGNTATFYTATTTAGNWYYSFTATITLSGASVQLGNSLGNTGTVGVQLVVAKIG